VIQCVEEPGTIPDLLKCGSTPLAALGVVQVASATQIVPVEAPVAQGDGPAGSVRDLNLAGAVSECPFYQVWRKKNSIPLDPGTCFQEYVAGFRLAENHSYLG
jgi:hypothetical protein